MSNLQRIRENAENVFFACSRFNGYRCELEATLEQSIKPETLVEVMLFSNEAWKNVKPSRPKSSRTYVAKSNKETS